MNEVAIIISLGIGDIVFLEIGIRLLLMNGFKKVHLFCRPDGMNLYHAYSGVQTHPLKSFKHYGRIDIPVISIDRDTHNDSGNRANIFAEAIISQAGLDITVPENMIPQLPVDELHLDWAETYIKPQEGEEIIIWQMESSRVSKSLPRATSLAAIQMLLDAGKKVLVLTNNHQGFPRHRNLILLRGIAIERFMALCMVATRVIALDSAPSWIAGAVGAETIAIFGPTDPSLFCPNADNIKVMLWHGGCHLQPCGNVMPGCNNQMCLDIPPDILFMRIMGKLDFAMPSGHSQSIPKWSVDFSKHLYYHENTIAIMGLEGMGGTMALSDIAEKVKKKYPDKKLSMIVRNYPELFKNNPYIDEVILVGSISYIACLEHFKDKFWALADIRFAMAKWYGNIPHKFPSPKFQELYDNHPIGQNLLGCLGFHYLDIVSDSLGLPMDYINSHIYFDIPESEIEGDYIVITNGVDVWHKGMRQTKCWPYWEELVKYIDVPFVQVGTNYDAPVPGAMDLRGLTSIEKLCSVLKHAYAIIVTEGGLMHMAYALGCEKVIIIRGPTASPLLEYPGQICVDSMLCEPCMFSTDLWYKECPNGLQEPECMYSISAERVKMTYENMVSV
jgi:ADP-heptose:LPS heptosyltransferase